MSKLEHTVEDKRRAAREAERLLALQDMNAGLRNDYELSKKARLAFRVGQVVVFSLLDAD